METPICYVELKFDGALFRVMGGGVGTILWDNKGIVQFASSKKEVGDFSVNDIETLATL